MIAPFLVLGPLVCKESLGGASAWALVVAAFGASEVLSRVSAYYWIASLAFLPLGFAVAGPAADHPGISATLWAGAAWMLASTGAVLAVRSVREVRRREPEAEREEGVAAAAS